MASQQTSLDEIKAVLEALPGPDEAARAACATRESVLTKPAGALGRLEEIALWYCTWSGRHPPTITRPRVAVFAGNHGVAQRGVSAFPPEVTAQMVANFSAGGAAVNQLAQLADADLRVYELSLAQPTADFTTAPAMDEASCARAIAYGMTVVEEGVDLLAVGEMGIGNTTAAAAMATLLCGGEAADWVGRGTGVEAQGLTHKRNLVHKATRAHQKQHPRTDPWRVLQHFGGYELAAIVGAIIAARMGRVPVLLDGYASTVAASVLHVHAPELLDHTLVAHTSAEQPHARLCTWLNKAPLLNLSMRLGEASGAALAINLVKAATLCHSQMSSFEDAGVSTRSP